MRDLADLLGISLFLAIPIVAFTYIFYIFDFF